MSDTAWTITGFILVGLGVLAVVGFAPFFFMTGDSSHGRQYAKPEGLLVIAAVIGPPVLISAIYITAIVLACKASGPTAHYPWIVALIGGPLWFALVGAVGYAKGNLMYWLPRSRNAAPHGSTWTGAPLTSSDALAVLERWAAHQSLGITVHDMQTDRFPYGWTIYTSGAAGNAQTALDTGAPVYLVGDSGAVCRYTSGNLQDIRKQFSRAEIRRRTRD